MNIIKNDNVFISLFHSPYGEWCMIRKPYQAEQIIMHLSKYNIQEYEFGIIAPYEITQEGIAKALGIGRNNVPRILKKLVEKGYVEEKKAHVEGAKHIRKVYILTPKGFLHLKELMEKYGLGKDK